MMPLKVWFFSHVFPTLPLGTRDSVVAGATPGYTRIRDYLVYPGYSPGPVTSHPSVHSDCRYPGGD